MRAAIDERIVEEYAEHLRAGGTLPAVTAFRDEARRTYLADGFHRVRAHERAERTEIDAEIYSGTQEDALWCALGANRAHGHRLTSARQAARDRARAQGMAGEKPETNRRTDRVQPPICQ